jgi:hypothetical protein
MRALLKSSCSPSSALAAALPPSCCLLLFDLVCVCLCVSVCAREALFGATLDACSSPLRLAISRTNAPLAPLRRLSKPGPSAPRRPPIRELFGTGGGVAPPSPGRPFPDIYPGSCRSWFLWIRHANDRHRGLQQPDKQQLSTSGCEESECWKSVTLAVSACEKLGTGKLRRASCISRLRDRRLLT